MYVEPYRPLVAVGQRPSSAQCRALWFPPVLTGTGHMQQLSGACEDTPGLLLSVAHLTVENGLSAPT